MSEGGDFTRHFREGIERLGFDEEVAAAFFDTSVPTVRRWLAGAVVPPAHALVLTRLSELLAREDKLQPLLRRIGERMKQLGATILSPACGLQQCERCPVNSGDVDDTGCDCPCHRKETNHG